MVTLQPPPLYSFMPSILGPGHGSPYSGSPRGASWCPLWWGTPILPPYPSAFWFSGPGPLQGGPIWRCQLLGGGVEGWGMGWHWCYLPRYWTQRWRKTLPAGAQRKLLAVAVYTHWVCCLAWQPEDHSGCTTLPQNWCVSGTPERSVVFLQRVRHSGASAHLSLPILSATVSSLPPGPWLYFAYLPPWGRQWKTSLTFLPQCPRPFIAMLVKRAVEYFEHYKMWRDDILQDIWSNSHRCWWVNLSWHTVKNQMLFLYYLHEVSP